MDNILSSKSKHKQYEAVMDYWQGAFEERYDDTKRHFEMLRTALPIAQKLKPKTILTIGDNRGRDAYFFKKNLGCHATASDLDITKLLPAKADGFIDDCKVIDVEKIDYPDNSIDLVVVKESFHHWPRPMLGFYEILRVARLGIVLIEPYDARQNAELNAEPYITPDSYYSNYEEVGNFLYSISLREILKASWALYLDHVVAKGFNDPYKSDFTFKEWLKEKAYLDSLGESGEREFNLMTIFVEKEIGALDLTSLEGYKIYHRPKSPYASDDL